MLLFEKNYLTDSQFLHPRNTFARNVTKHLLVEKMPVNSSASWIRLTSYEPQQKCIHCNSILTDNILTFDKTKYGENTIVNQMTKMMNKTSSVTSARTQFSESLL